MTRSDANENLLTLITNQNLIRHSYACEAIMIALCHKLNPDANEITLNKWGTVGLLHDADYELTLDTPGKHGLLIEEKIGYLLDNEELYAIKAHNYLHNGVLPLSKLDWSIYCCDELSGLLVASALIHPDKKLASLNLDFIMNRFNDPNFAKGANRTQIKTCEEKLSIPLPEFIQIALSAMQSISSDLNL
jgi:uncharacterized protein